MIQEFRRIRKISGELHLPGDKSISHRALLFSAMARGISEIENLADGDDVNSTINCLESIGADIERVGRSAKIKGRGYKNFAIPDGELIAGNSGTTARLLAGLLAAQNFDSIIIGDESLSKRPMNRIVQPLKQMGANISTSELGTLPIKIFPVAELGPIDFTLPIPSAQVKSSVIIAGLHSESKTIVRDPFSTRDHTERMLNLDCRNEGGERIISFSKDDYPKTSNYFIPSDISTASFFIVLALLSNGSELRLKNISLNPTRIGVIKVLQMMGGKILFENMRESNNEPFGDIIVCSSSLQNIQLEKNIIPSIIDEIPILSIARLFANGTFQIRNAGELRFKESDRIKSLCYNFRLLGLDVNEFEDGFAVAGEMKERFPLFESFGDHRIAMSFAVLSMLLEKGGRVNHFDCVNISNPNFLKQLYSISIT